MRWPNQRHAIGFGARSTGVVDALEPACVHEVNSNIAGGSLNLASYQAYANYLSNYIASVQAQGVPLYAISIQNEPNYSASYDSALWSGQNFHDFILNNLGPTLAAHGQSSTQIMRPETVWDPSITDAVIWGGLINHWMVTGNLNAFHYWWAVGESSDNEGLIYNGVASKRLYAIGNFSKFVTLGYVRIGATLDPQYHVSVSAYKNPSTGDFAIVVVNQTFSYFLPESSVVTFIGTAH